MGDLLTDPRKIVNKWMNYFCQLLNVQRVEGIRQTEIQTSEPFVPEPSSLRLRLLLETWKDLSRQVLIRFRPNWFKRGETLHSEIHKLIKLIWNKEELLHQWEESIVVPIHKKGDKTECSNYGGISLLPTSYKIVSNILLCRLIS
jgi:hypothetical protein